jgi:hypothetical protein
MNTFRTIIGAKPKRKALIELRGFFRCTGTVTRDQRRRPEEMAAAFEGKAAVILQALKEPSILLEVANILVAANQRVEDREEQWASAAYFIQSTQALKYPEVPTSENGADHGGC